MKKILLLLAFFQLESLSSEALRAKPVLFIEHGMHKYSLELQEKDLNVRECCSKNAQEYINIKEIVVEKMMIILNDLVKKYNACAVQRYTKYNTFCIDPAYDITKEAFDRLNKEYLESKSR